MKFTAIACLLGATSAISLRTTSAIGLRIASQIKTQEDEKCPTPQQVIDHYDQDKNGKMNLEEATVLFNDIMDHIGMDEPSDNIKEWAHTAFKKIAGKDHEINAKEMAHVLHELLPGGENWCHGPSVEEVSGFFDTDKDGFINEDEFNEGMGKVAAHLGFEPGPEEKKWVEKIFKKVGGKDKKISHKELESALDHLYGRK